MGRRALLACCTEWERIAQGWLSAETETDLQNVCLVNIGFLKTFLWMLEIRVGGSE